MKTPLIISVALENSGEREQSVSEYRFVCHSAAAPHFSHLTSVFRRLVNTHRTSASQAVREPGGVGGQAGSCYTLLLYLEWVDAFVSPTGNDVLLCVA